MKVDVQKIESSKAEATIEITAEKFEESMEKAYRTMVKKVNIPGFRKGKAPRRIVENIYGREALYEDAFQDALPNAFFEALEQIKDEYIAVSEPEYEIVTVEKDQPLVFKARFYLKPEVTLGTYKGLELEKPTAEVKEEAVQAELEKMQKNYAQLTVSEEPVAKGDVLNIDFVGKVDGQPFEGGTAENYSLEIGSNTFIPGFEDQLVGAAIGSTVDVNVTFPEDYRATELAGKPAVFTVTIKESKRKVLAELDDEFAKDVSDFSTLQELRSDIENKLKEAAEKQAESQLRAAAIQKVVEASQVDIPAPMVESQVRRMVENLAVRLSQQGIPFEYYMQATNRTVEEIKKGYEPEAEATVKADLILEAVAKAENITVSQEEMEKHISDMAAEFKQDAAKLRENLEKGGQLPNLEFGIMMDKTIDYIISEAKVS